MMDQVTVKECPFTQAVDTSGGIWRVSDRRRRSGFGIPLGRDRSLGAIEQNKFGRQIKLVRIWTGNGSNTVGIGNSSRLIDASNGTTGQRVKEDSNG